MRLIDADALIEKMKDCGFSTAQELMANAFCFAALKSESLAPTIGGWISVKDKLPDDTAKGRLYLVVNNGNVDVGIFHYGLWLLPTNNVNVSHWMPFPDAPKEGE